MRHSKLQQTAYTLFIGSVLYVGGTLPCGRFYHEAVEGLSGNILSKLSYQYIFSYMGLIVHVIDLLERGALSLPFFKLYCDAAELAVRLDHEPERLSVDLPDWEESELAPEEGELNSQGK
jgi:hypothetical protein